VLAPLPDKVMDWPEQTVALVVFATTVGSALTVTDTPAVAVPQALVAVMVYIPLAEDVAPVRVGFWTAEVYALGPFHK
jgi:hypothetical protein